MTYFFRSIRYITRHPLNRSNKIKALFRWLRWQMLSRFQSGPHLVPFVNKTKLLVDRGMTGATGSIYCGIHDFEAMGLLLHALRPGDAFVDVGANVGSYTILCASLGVTCYAFEPIPKSYERLTENIRLNKMERLVHPFNIAVTDMLGKVTMTTEMGALNKIYDCDQNTTVPTMDVESVTLDAALKGISPFAIKIDVEGFEAHVLKGSPRIFQEETLQVVIMEINNETIHKQMQLLGFLSYSYDPMSRNLQRRGGTNEEELNTVYIRDASVLEQRFKSAPAFEVFNQKI